MATRPGGVEEQLLDCPLDGQTVDHEDRWQARQRLSDVIGREAHEHSGECATEHDECGGRLQQRTDVAALDHLAEQQETDPERDTEQRHDIDPAASTCVSCHVWSPLSLERVAPGRSGDLRRALQLVGRPDDVGQWRRSGSPTCVPEDPAHVRQVLLGVDGESKIRAAQTGRRVQLHDAEI